MRLFVLQIYAFVFVLFLFSHFAAFAQQHEPDLKWQTLKTEHFSIHVPREYKQLALRIAAICEQVYDPVSRSLNYFPGHTHVVIHSRSDVSNGFVSPLPWRMELYVTEPHPPKFFSLSLPIFVLLIITNQQTDPGNFFLSFQRIFVTVQLDGINGIVKMIRFVIQQIFPVYPVDPV